MDNAIKFLFDLAANNSPTDWGLTFVWLLALMGLLTIFLPPKNPK